MVKYCTECHGDKAVKAGYDLDSYKAIMKGGKKGVAVVPGQPDKSLLLRTMDGRAKLMPPKKYGKEMTDAEIATIRAWIAAGAKARPSRGAPSRAAKRSRYPRCPAASAERARPRSASSSAAVTLRQPRARGPGPWQSLPPLTASPRAAAQPRSWRCRALRTSG